MTKEIAKGILMRLSPSRLLSDCVSPSQSGIRIDDPFSELFAHAIFTLVPGFKYSEWHMRTIGELLRYVEITE